MNLVPVSIFQAFNISISVQFPTGFNNLIQVDAIPNQDTVDGFPRVKLCSAVVSWSGQNLPCPKCMNSGIISAYAQNDTFNSTYDSFTWYSSVRTYDIVSTNDDPDANTMT